MNTRDYVLATQLCQLATVGDLKEAQLLLDDSSLTPSKISQILAYTDKYGTSALSLAVENNHLEMVRFLLSKGASISIHSDIFDRASKKNLKIAKELGMAIQSRKLAWSTWDLGNKLCSAAKNGELEIIPILVGIYRVKNQPMKDLFGHAISYTNYKSALLLATENNHVEIVKYLLENGADLTCHDLKFKTVFDYAYELGHMDILKVLLTAGFKQRDEKGSDLQYIQNEYIRLFDDAIKNNSLLKIRVMFKVIEEHAPQFLFKLWMSAATTGDLKKLTEFVNLADDPFDLFDHTDEKGQDALYLAAANGHTQVVAFLLSKGVNPTTVAHDGTTALDVAFANKHFTVVEDLIKNSHPADQLAMFERLVSPGTFDLASGKIQTFIEHAPFPGELYNHLRTLGPDNLDGYAPIVMAHFLGLKLIEAVAKADLTRIKELIGPLKAEDLDLMVNFTDQNGLTPLHYAAAKDHVHIVEYLLSKGADPTITTRDGKTAFDLAVEKDFLVIAETLIKNSTPSSRSALFKNIIKPDPMGATTLVAKVQAFMDHVPCKAECLNYIYTLGADQMASQVPIVMTHVLGTKLIEAAVRGDAAEVQDLLGPLVDDALDNLLHFELQDKTAFDWAFENGHDAVVKALLTPSSLAAKFNLFKNAVIAGDLAKLNFLMAHFHEWVPRLFTMQDPNKKTLLHLALDHHRVEVADVLLKFSEAVLTPPILIQAVKTGNLDMVKVFFKNVRSTQELLKRQYGYEYSHAPLLYWAVKHNRYEIVRYLLEQGADPNAVFVHEGASTPQREIKLLYLATENGSNKIVDILLEHGATLETLSPPPAGPRPKISFKPTIKSKLNPTVWAKVELLEHKEHLKYKLENVENKPLPNESKFRFTLFGKKCTLFNFKDPVKEKAQKIQKIKNKLQAAEALYGRRVRKNKDISLLPHAETLNHGWLKTITRLTR